MNRRKTLKAFAGAAITSASGLTSHLAFAATQSMVTVVKIAGIPWFNAVEKGIKKGAKDFNIDATMVGPVIAALFRTLLDIYGTEFNKQLDLVHHAPGGQKPGERSEI